MKRKAILLIVVVDVIVLLVGFLFYMGAFRSTPIEQATFASREIVFSTHRGPYSGLEKAWMQFQADWEKAGLDQCDAVGVFLDPPGTPEDQIRSILGCRVDALPDALRTKLKATFKSFVIPEGKALYTSFPYRNKLSFMIAPMKVYPRMVRVLESSGAKPAAVVETYGPGAQGPDMGFYMLTGLDRSVVQPLMDSFN